MAKANEPFGDPYDLDGVAFEQINAGVTDQAALPYPTGRGDVGMDGISSIDSKEYLGTEGDDAYGKGAPVPLDAVTEVPVGKQEKGTPVRGHNTKVGANLCDYPPGYGYDK